MIAAKERRASRSPAVIGRSTNCGTTSNDTFSRVVDTSSFGCTSAALGVLGVERDEPLLELALVDADVVPGLPEPRDPPPTTASARYPKLAAGEIAVTPRVRSNWRNIAR